MKYCYAGKEHAREKEFQQIWSNDIDDVFSDVARYYDRANIFASLGLLNSLQNRFISTMDIQPHQKVLDVCAGTNVIGINLLHREPSLDIHAVDRSVAMQEVGRERASRHGLEIKSFISDVHQLPFPDNHFDVVTLQWATRHLRVIEVFSEINRVLKPGGYFHHCDMLRPASRLVEKMYYVYSMKCRNYFIHAIRMFYSTEELSALLSELGFSQITGRSVLGGTVGFHKARKPLPSSES
jgi:demethylmenaquinone methyltransferase/2-methoxy-6-polyprenyl-1,4-benzoquinol methylase